MSIIRIDLEDIEVSCGPGYRHKNIRSFSALFEECLIRDFAVLPLTPTLFIDIHQPCGSTHVQYGSAIEAIIR